MMVPKYPNGMMVGPICPYALSKKRCIVMRLGIALVVLKMP